MLRKYTTNHIACRIARHVCLVAYPFTDTVEVDVSVLQGGEAVRRTFEMSASNWHLMVVQFSTDTDRADLTLSCTGKAIVHLRMVANLSDFMDELGLMKSELAGLSGILFGTVAALFRLREDPDFVETVNGFSMAENIPSGIARAHVVAGLDDAIMIVAKKAGLTETSSVIAVGSHVSSTKVLAARPVLADSLDDVDLVAVRFSRGHNGVRFLLVIQEGSILRLDLQATVSDDLKGFFKDHGGAGADFPAILARYGSKQTSSDLNALERGESLRYRPVHIPQSGFIFSLDQTFSLEGGLFVSGWFHDPNGLFASATLIDHSLGNPHLDTTWTRFSGLTEFDGVRRVVDCFCAFIERDKDIGSLAQPMLRVALRNGESHHALSHYGGSDALFQRSQILDAIHPRALAIGALERVFQPALSSLTALINARQSIATTVEYGEKSSRKVSIIIPLYGETGFLRSQILGFASDPFIRENCEIIFVLDDPALETTVAHRLGGIPYIARLDLRLVTLKCNGGYAMANNMAASVAEGEILILMNSDVVPEKPGWLLPCIERLGALPTGSVIGPKLLYADDGLQHAGMYFLKMPSGLWQNMHYYKGYGRDFTPGDVERLVPAVTGAVMVLGRDDFLAVGGFTTDYIVGDYEDSDLCLKLRRAGGQCLYFPQVALYHFERQSMGRLEVVSESGSTTYNRALHSQKWSDEITALMASKEFLPYKDFLPTKLPDVANVD